MAAGAEALLARRNPFRSERIEALAFRDFLPMGELAGEQSTADTLIEPLLARFEALGRRAVLVGPHGSGKTTLREALGRALIARGWRVRSWVLSDDGEVDPAAFAMLVTDLSQRDVLSVDGLDSLGGWRWRRLMGAARAAGGIIATSHVRGRLPILREHRTSPALLRELVAELIAERVDGAARERSAPGLAPGLAARCDQLFAEHRGDVRACLRSLYDDYASGGSAVGGMGAPLGWAPASAAMRSIAGESSSTMVP